jgi:KaiC/GvpD/RAD55 family RecA-like ATPase
MVENKKNNHMEGIEGGKESFVEAIKEDILLPYTLEVIKLIRDIESNIKDEYRKKKNSTDQKSLEVPVEISIDIKLNEKSNCYKRLVMKVIELCIEAKENEWEAKLSMNIVILILARVLKYDNKDLWKRINDLLVEKKPLTQPFYEFRNQNDNHIILVIKDYFVIPKDFVASYFGFDTGIDGLNLLFNGGFLLPPDRSSYISIGGEAGIGKTALAVKLITAFFQNYRFKNVYQENETGQKKKINHKNAELLSIHYILMEQRDINIIKLIHECDLIKWENKNIYEKMSETQERTIEKKIRTIIDFVPSHAFSPMRLLEQVEDIENNEKNKDKRKVIVIDSVNAIQEMDIKRTEWRELFQGIKAITEKKNTIVIFVVEKDPRQPDFIMEYISDVVINLHKEYRQEAYCRIIELVESRFQTLFHGKHPFYITGSNSGFIRVYPSTAAMAELIPHRKRLHPANIDGCINRGKLEREVGIKIDGILNFFKYSHLYSTKMAPFFLKNSVTMFTGDRGAHKSAFAKKFALSAFRDERWETTTGSILEFDYREQEANKPWEELMSISFWNAKPIEKAIAILLLFSENYNEDPETDTVWETHFGKVIIPGCKAGEDCIGKISHIVCAYEVKDMPEEVYIYQLDELIRTLESYKVSQELPNSYYEFISQRSLSLLNRNKKADSGNGENPINFNPYNIMYKGDYIKNIDIIEKFERLEKLENHKMSYCREAVRIREIPELIAKFLKDVSKTENGLENLINLLEKFWKNSIFETFETYIEMPINTNKEVKKGKNVDELITVLNQYRVNLLEKIAKDPLRKVIELRFEELYDCIDHEKKKGAFFKKSIKKLQTNIENERKKGSREKNKISELHGKLDDEKEKEMLYKKRLLALFAELSDVVFIVKKDFNLKVDDSLNEILEEVKAAKEVDKKGTLRQVFNEIEILLHRIDFVRRMFIYRSLRPRKAFKSKRNKDGTGFVNVGSDEETGPTAFERSLFNMEIWNSIYNSEEENFKFPDNAIDYQFARKVKVSRLILDDAENLENVYNSLNPKRYISTLSHLCLAREITLGIVNTRIREETSEVETVCNAISDNAFKFDEYFFKGELFTAFHIVRSATGFHNNMMYFLTKREDSLLQLKNTFALLSDVEKHTPEPLEIRLFLPDLSKEFSKYMYRMLIERDMHLSGKNLRKVSLYGVVCADRVAWERHSAKRFDLAKQFEIEDENKQIMAKYDMQARFPSIFKDWQDFLEDMITYSLAHPKVVLYTANDPFTDISIILEDESAKEAITILCLPGYLMDLYEKNLASISDYVQFPGEEDNAPVKVRLDDDEKWIWFDDKCEINGGTKDNEGIKFGNEFHYLQKAEIRIPKSREVDDDKKHRWIIPEILFNPAVARDETTNKIIKKRYKNEKYLEIKGYPYYIDPRVNLIFTLEDSNGVGSEENYGDNRDDVEPEYFIHNTAHDFVAMFFELWFKIVTKDTCSKPSPCVKRENKSECTYCAFHAASEELSKLNIVVEDFANHVVRSVKFDKEGIITKLEQLMIGNVDGNRIVLREWYSSAQQKLKVLEPFLLVNQKRIKVKLHIPSYFLYTTWYLAIPVNSPRKNTASEIIIKMTEPPDLAHLQISGIGLQTSERFYDEEIYKCYPEYHYHEVLKAMKNLLYGKKNKKIGAEESEKENNKQNIGIPIASIHCYFEHLTLLGGILGDFYRNFSNFFLMGNYLDSESDARDISLKKEKDKLLKKIEKFSTNFKSWQKNEKRRCDSCYMTYLFCNRKE